MPYENIIFEGGAIKGFAHCGGLQVLEERDIYKNLKRFGGSSVGACIAALAALGYTSKEITNIFFSFDFEQVLNTRCFPRNVFNLFNSYGWKKGIYFEAMYKKYIYKKTKNNNYTFRQLFDDRGIELAITGYNLSMGHTIYFSKDTYPNMPIRIAVEISTSVPCIVQPVEFEGDLYIDGGILDNYPIHMFDGFVPGDSINFTNKPNEHTIGFKLMTSDETTTNIAFIRKPINNIIDYSYRVIDAYSSATDKMLMKEKYWERTVPIYVEDIPMTTFRISNGQKQKLVQDGRDAVEKFLDKAVEIKDVVVV